MKAIWFIFFFSCFWTAKAQDTIQSYQFLKSVDIVDVQEGFDAQVFIEKVKADTSYYKAFLNLRYYPHVSVGRLAVYNKKNEDLGTLYREGNHLKTAGQFWIALQKTGETGKVINRKGKYKYYTAEMFDHAFYPKDTFTASNVVTKNKLPDTHESKMQKHKNDIKMMMFNPGAAISDVPVVGKKMAIFDDEMVPYYDYHIWYTFVGDSIPCYALSCEVKDSTKADATVIKELTSWFNAETMEIMKRTCHLKYKHLLFDFDVTIIVDLKKQGHALVPSLIQYKGWWDVPLHKREFISFDVRCSNFKIE